MAKAKSKTGASVAELIAGTRRDKEPVQAEEEQEREIREPVSKKNQEPATEKVRDYRVQLPEQIHIDAKMNAIRAGTSLKQYIIDAIREKNERAQA